MCKTCSENKHVCLGYTDSTTHLRSQSDSSSRPPAIQSLAGAQDSNQRNARAVESCSPEPKPRLPPATTSKSDKQAAPKPVEKPNDNSRDATTRIKKDSGSQESIDTPDSSEQSPSTPRNIALILIRRLFRPQLGGHEQPHPCSILSILRANRDRAWV